MCQSIFYLVLIFDLNFVIGVSPMVQCAKSVAMNIEDHGAIDTWRRQNGLVGTFLILAGIINLTKC